LAVAATKDDFLLGLMGSLWPFLGLYAAGTVFYRSKLLAFFGGGFLGLFFGGGLFFVLTSFLALTLGAFLGSAFLGFFDWGFLALALFWAAASLLFFGVGKLHSYDWPLGLRLSKVFRGTWEAWLRVRAVFCAAAVV